MKQGKQKKLDTVKTPATKAPATLPTKKAVAKKVVAKKVLFKAGKSNASSATAGNQRAIKRECIEERGKSIGPSSVQAVGKSSRQAVPTKSKVGGSGGLGRGGRLVPVCDNGNHLSASDQQGVAASHGPVRSFAQDDGSHDGDSPNQVQQAHCPSW